MTSCEINGLQQMQPYIQGESDSMVRQAAIWLNAFLVQLRNKGQWQYVDETHCMERKLYAAVS